MRQAYASLLAATIFAFNQTSLHAEAGIEGASFLDIPVGAQPAALGSAYTANATNSYAPVWNPGALPFVTAIEASAMHLVYLDSVHYNFMSVALPLGRPESGIGPSQAGWGVSAQYLGTSDIDGRDDAGNPIGSAKASNGAFTLAYGQRLRPNLSWGSSVKLITQSIADVSARAYAVDFGMLWKFVPHWQMGLAVSNVGTPLKMVEQEDPLPMNGRLGLAWQQTDALRWSAESVYRRNGNFDLHGGAEWTYAKLFSIRGGYSNAHTQGLSSAAGFTAGFGIHWGSHEYSYGWVPFGPLGYTHYLSVNLRFHAREEEEAAEAPTRMRRARHNDEDELSIQHPEKKKIRDEWDSIYDLLTEDERKAAEPAR